MIPLLLHHAGVFCFPVHLDCSDYGSGGKEADHIRRERRFRKRDASYGAFDQRCERECRPGKKEVEHRRVCRIVFDLVHHFRYPLLFCMSFA